MLSASTPSCGSEFHELTACCFTEYFLSFTYLFQQVPPSSGIQGLGEQQLPVPLVCTLHDFIDQSQSRKVQQHLKERVIEQCRRTCILKIP